MEEVHAWGSEFEALKVSFYIYKKRGELLDGAEQQRFAASTANLKQRLKQLKEIAAAVIPVSEIARRETLLANLEAGIRVSSRDTGTTAGGLGCPNMSTSANASASSSYTVVSNSDVVNPMELSGRGLAMYSQQKIDEQDQIIAEIGSGVVRLHAQAEAIGTEAVTQNALLSSLDDNVEIGAEELRTEALHAEEVRKKSKTCYLYMCIVLELVVLSVLIMIYMNHSKISSNSNGSSSNSSSSSN